MESKYGHLPRNWFDAVVNKAGGEAGANAFLRDELVLVKPNHKWCEYGGIIYFSVTSDGTTGEGWITRLESRGFRVGEYAKQLLRSADFKPTTGVTTDIAALKGTLFEDDDRITKKIRTLARGLKFEAPNAEVACLIRDKFSDEEIEAMGLTWIITMHEPIEDSDGYPGLLGAGRDGSGRWLRAYSGRPDDRWVRDDGFAFAVSPACR